MQKITVLGSTGSIGVNTLDVIQRHPDRYQVYALTANQNEHLLIEQAKSFQPEYVVLVQPPKTAGYESLLKDVSPNTQLLVGKQALSEVSVANTVDVVMAAIVGAAGLIPTLAAAKHGKKVLLANKESLVVAGDLFMDTVRESGAVLLPIDSEHNAIFQCLPGDYGRMGFNASGVEKVLLTGSGGPFRTLPIPEFANVTPEQACAHPNWDMGKKISVDSATMMNKGLELIEACHLFSLSSEQVQVVLHPQSIVHSMVRYVDGSVLAQMGQPDMRTPIAYGLAWPERIYAGVEPLDFFSVSQLEFSQPDFERYPCLKLAIDAFEEGASKPAVLNAANEVSVAAFLQRKIRFTDIAKINRAVLEQVSGERCSSIDELLMVDLESRRIANEKIGQLN